MVVVVVVDGDGAVDLDPTLVAARASLCYAAPAVAMTVRRALARVAIATAATIAVVSVVSRCEQEAAKDIEVEVDVGLVPGVRAAQVELRRGTSVVAWAERRYDGGLRGPLKLRGPALGADGEVRIRLDTDEGPRSIRRPLTAAAGSTVTIRVGE